MNKKILFLTLLSVLLILPSIIFAEGVLPPQLGQALDNIYITVLSIGLTLVVIGFAIAGILYLISAGSPEKMVTARKAFIAAVIGGVLIVLAQASQVLINILKGIIGV